jgi:hypothetical protein
MTEQKTHLAKTEKQTNLANGLFRVIAETGCLSAVFDGCLDVVSESSLRM